MEFVFYAVLFIVTVLLVANFVQLLIYPPLEIQPADLPEVVQQELKNCFPNFRPAGIKLLRPRQRYLMNGKISDTPSRVLVDLTPDQELVKVEFSDDSGPSRFSNKRPIPTTTVPPQISAAIRKYLPATLATGKDSTAFSGMIGSEQAYQIKIHSDEFDYEFEITQAGRLVGFEKVHPHA